MFMRYLGGGVRHKGIAPASSDLELAVALKRGLTGELAATWLPDCRR